MEKQLGSLPVIADFSRRLDIAGVVDRACPIREVASISHGQVIEALIANRLTSPKAMVAVADWAHAWAVEEVYDIDPDLLNDDRLGRALDALADQADQVVGSIGATAITAFGIDVTRCHWDMTSISLYGAYDHVDDEYPTPAYGHPKDRRTDLKQIQAGLAVTADGAVPVLSRTYDGNAAEIAQVTDTMRALQALATPRNFLLVGDSKLISYPNVTAMTTEQVTFIAPLAASRVPDGLFAGLDPSRATIVDYVAERDEGRPHTERCTYRVDEDTMDLTGPRKKDPVHTLRRILVHSTANATAQAKARALRLAQARTELDTLTRTAGTRHHRTIEAVTTKATAIARRRRISAHLHTTITTDDTGKPTFAWTFDQAALDAEAAADGWYALLTNLPADIDATDVFLRYKDQPTVERRYSEFKGPLAVAPIFLRNNRRITALITVICLALLIFCLIEREVRRNLAPDTEIRGFYINDRRPRKPTGRLILQALGELRLIPAPPNEAATIPTPGPLQTRLLRLLHVDPTQPRWP
ncbi:IS1634 family transposase [Micromonospora sp. Llam0]|uniref:IS1634 family transposase n=1 Tax=Micromonospora sp. Llam0 TaxID=2485143 RepID=UPI000F49F1B8|nr:IS1634 family transposase [Micromonospora sp. Llam0]